MANPEHVKLVKAGAVAIETVRHDREDLRLDLIEADLNRADLSHVDLSHADLFMANLSHANLSHTNLDYAYLNEANLTHANLRVANLDYADLSGANLSRADLSRANLSGANLSAATLTGADLTDSCWNGTAICNTVFDEVATLARTFHNGPSSLGLDTIERNAGNLPDHFLRGCGVPEAWIDYIHALTGSPFEFYSCFISYNHDDKRFARQLHDRLQGKGIRCWLDEHAMVPGDDMYRKVDEGIRIWDKVLLCCSGSSLQSPWVEREIDTAIEKEMDFQKSKGEQILKIIPLNLDGSLFDWTGSHAATLRKRLAADFTGWKSDADKFEHQFENVVKALRTDRGQLPPPKPILGT